MSFLEVSLRFRLNAMAVGLIKLSEASNTLEIYVVAISVQEMVPSPPRLKPKLSGEARGGRRGAAHY